MGKITKPFFCAMSICRFPSTTLALFGLVWFKLFEFIKKKAVPHLEGCQKMDLQEKQNCIGWTIEYR